MPLEWNLPNKLLSWLIVIKFTDFFLKNSYVIYLSIKMSPVVTISPRSQMTKLGPRETQLLIV